MILVAEVGCNHMGNMGIARRMVEVAAECGADVVKFQKRTVRDLLTPEQYEAPHPNPDNSFGATYGEHREALEFTLEQHGELREACRECGVGYGCSVWDTKSAEQIAGLRPDLFKIPSACNTDVPMLEWVFHNYPSSIDISLGMTTPDEESDLTRLAGLHNRLADITLYACTSGYPVPFNDIGLLDILRLKHQYRNRVRRVGFSGHHLGIAVDIAAMTLGASVIERHFTLDRTWKGTDHAASLEPNGLQRLARDLVNVQSALQGKAGVLPVEYEQRIKLKRIIHGG